MPTKSKTLKRPANDINQENEENNIDPRNFPSPSTADEASETYDYDEIRSLVLLFLDLTGMQKKDLVAELKVNTRSFNAFMKQNGKDKGAKSVVAQPVIEFVEKFLSKDSPPLKRRRTDVERPPLQPVSANSTKKTACSSKRSGTTMSALAAQIVLDDEMDDAVEVYDSCDEIRRKINAHLRKPNVTQAAFVRDLHAQMHGPRKPKWAPSAQLIKFRSQKGSMAGNTSSVYYAAYVFFEKERIAAGKPKSLHREEMEDAWWLDGGVDLKTNPYTTRYIIPTAKNLGINDLGRTFTY